MTLHTDAEFEMLRKAFHMWQETAGIWESRAVKAEAALAAEPQGAWSDGGKVWEGDPGYWHDGYREGMRDALNDLQSAEAFYRKVHDFNGDGHIHTGRAWDKLRKAGDRARAALDGTEEIANQIIAQVCTCGGDLKQLPAHHDISCPASLSTAPPEQPAADPWHQEASDDEKIDYAEGVLSGDKQPLDGETGV